MAFEGAWLPTTRDSWIAPERGKAGRLGGWMGGRCGGGSGAPSCPAVKLCSISPAALWACLDHQRAWFLCSSDPFPFKTKKKNHHPGREVWCRVKAEQDGQSDRLKTPERPRAEGWISRAKRNYSRMMNCPSAPNAQTTAEMSLQSPTQRASGNKKHNDCLQTLRFKSKRCLRALLFQISFL